MSFSPVGFVRHSLSDEEVDATWGGFDARVEVLPEYEPALTGIENFSHAILVSYLHKPRGRSLLVRPGLCKLSWAGLDAAGAGIDPSEVPEVGIFCVDGPVRPNGIGISVVELRGEGRRGRILEVSGCDLYNGTPIIDIRAFYPYRCPRGEVRVDPRLVSLFESVEAMMARRRRAL